MKDQKILQALRRINSYRTIPLNRMNAAAYHFQLDKPNVILTLGENLAVGGESLGKRGVCYTQNILSELAKNPHLLQEPSTAGALHKMFRSTAYRLTFTKRESDSKFIRFFPKFLNSHFFTFLDTYCSHNEDIAKLRPQMSDPNCFPDFEWLESQTEVFGPASHSTFEDEANDPTVIKTEENSGEYTLYKKHKIAAYVFQGLVINYPHNSVLYHNRQNTFWNMLHKSFLSSEDAIGIFDQCMNKAWYGCENEAVAREASDKMVIEHKVVSAFLKGIEVDLTKYYKKHGFGYPEPNPIDFSIFRS